MARTRRSVARPLWRAASPALASMARASSPCAASAAQRRPDCGRRSAFSSRAASIPRHCSRSASAWATAITTGSPSPSTPTLSSGASPPVADSRPVAASHETRVPARSKPTSKPPCRASEARGSGCRCRANRGWARVPAHSLTAWSRPPEASTAPSGEKAAQRAGRAWAGRLSRRKPVAASQRARSLSSPAVAKRVPSGDQAAAVTGWACPSSTRAARPVPASQILAVWSALAEARHRPSGDQARDDTARAWPVQRPDAWPLSGSRITTALPSPATARRWPSGDQATAASPALARLDLAQGLARGRLP